MQSAPSVVYPVGRSAVGDRVLVALAFLLATTMALGLATAQASAGAWVVSALAMASWGLWAWHDARRVPAGWLRWRPAARASVGEGAAPGCWCWQPSLQSEGVAIARVEPVLDLQARWLLRLTAAGHGAPRWLWVEAERAPTDWLALRRALMHARQGR